MLAQAVVNGTGKMGRVYIGVLCSTSHAARWSLEKSVSVCTFVFAHQTHRLIRFQTVVEVVELIALAELSELVGLNELIGFAELIELLKS